MAKKKTAHEIGRELKAELTSCPDGELIIGYAAFRRRMNIVRRDTKQINKRRRLLKQEFGVLIYPEVDGRLRHAAQQPWSEFKDKSTRIVCRLHGDAPSQRSSMKDERKLTANADLCVTDDNAMQVVVASGTHPHRLYDHQKKAVMRMTEKMTAKFAGVLVLPTGGGKTRTAVQWLLANVIDTGGKVLWLAHRHSLINQACNVFCQTAYRDVLRAKERFTCRKISGRHARPVDIRADDDVLIGSVFSLGRSSGPKHLREKWLSDQRPVCVVVDEAHHAPASTYRKVIKVVQDHRRDSRMLGLTATPFRTAKGEQGLMKKMFPGGVIYKVDLGELVTNGILAEPSFEEVKTDTNFELSDVELKKLIRTGGDFSKLGQAVCETLGKNRQRNRRIVDRYVDNKRSYGRTLIFALNIDNAIALTKLLKNRGVRADYVVSSLHDAEHYVNVSAARNEEVIKKFKDRTLDVLVNVNILTEGFDDPTIQTVFLARPTMSTILMMQMVGRALRGPRVPGGTKTANIVSFIDDWADKIRWKSPNELMACEEAKFADTPTANRTAVLKLVSIRLLEEYATFLDMELGPNVFGDVPFVRRIPVGVYVVSTFDERNVDDDEDCVLDQSADILVFEDAKTAFEECLKDAEQRGVPKQGTRAFDRETDRMMKKHFSYMAGLPFSPRRREIETMLSYLASYGSPPPFFEFNKRKDYDIERVADDIFSREDMGPKAVVEHLEDLWKQDPTGWQTFFGGDFRSFYKTIQDLVSDMAIKSSQADAVPVVIPGKKAVEDCSMAELYEKQPKEWKELRDSVYDSAYDRSTGEYRCAATGWRSRDPHDFQIDHIRPRSEGGKTLPDNLRLLRRRENAKKGTKWEEL